ncbi:hypothetical protein KAI92_02890 [Candidatus Parcubacteria bacterium]|nr:hypothetical protein [Candidatus Parcubacteria bacterium]
MDNISILDQIISDQKVAEINNMDAVRIIDGLLTELADREQDVLRRRYGLDHGKKETLESIGQEHGLTRERIRQIETSSIKKLQELKNLDEHLNVLRKVISQLLEEHGGFMEREYLKDALVGFSMDGAEIEINNKDVHKNYINFLITKLLHREFENIDNSKQFSGIYKFKHQEIEHFEEIASELMEEIKKLKKIHKTNEVLDLLKNLDSFNNHSDKIDTKNNIDIIKILKADLFNENPDLINNNKTLYSILRATDRIKQNKFGYWGYNKWKNITPKTINDKIYLVLKNKKKPMHFEEIANNINEVKFDKKNANPATVHNELILDKKYVLVGRGLYGLKDWGYKEGSVIDVIVEVLNDATKPLNRDQIIEKVLNKRVVKKATIILALMNKNKFEKIGDKYTFHENY